MAEPNTGMSAKNMKQVLMQASKPVYCAFAKGEGGFALLLLDKSQANQPYKDLKEKFDAKRVFKGTASLDPHDSKLVHFNVDASNTGLAKPLVKTVKLAGYKKVVIQAPGGEPEADGEDDDAAAPPAAPTAAGDPAAPAQAAPADPPPAAPSADAPAAPPADAAAAGAAEPAAVFARTKQVCVTAGTTWMTITTKLHGGLDALLANFAAAFKGHEMADELEAAVKDRLKPIREHNLDLVRKLAAAVKAPDHDKQMELLADAKKSLRDYQKFVAGDSTLDELDQNPFVPNLQAATTVKKSLEAIDKALEKAAA